jgi:hypothetical protein
LPVEKTVSDPLPPLQRPTDEKRSDPAATGVDELSLPLASLGLSGRWFARVEVYQYRTLLCASGPIRFKIANGNGSDRSERRSLRRSQSQAAIPPTSAAAPGEISPSQRQTSIALSPPSDALPTTKDALSPSPRWSAETDLPIGIYGARLEDFPALSAAGFNAAHVPVRDPAALSRALSEASRYGLTLLLSPAVASWPDSNLTPSAPVFFYLADEPEGRSVSPKLLLQSRAALRRRGLPQPGAIALLRAWRAPDYASAVDVFMSDPYPVPFEPLSWLAECLDEIGRTVAGDPAKRIWAVIQAFPWSSAHGHIDPSTAPPPTPAELKALVRLALLHGADGLFFYSLRSGDFRLQENPDLWNAVKESIIEARELKPILTAPTLSPAPTVYSPARDGYGLPAVHFKAVQPPSGPPLLIALNTLNRPVQAAIRLPGRPRPIPFALEPLGFARIAL